MNHRSWKRLVSKLNQRPRAWARVSGSEKYPELSGVVYFYQTNCGVLVMAEVEGLPDAADQNPGRFFAFHIHSGSQCSGTPADPFADTLGHYNPENMGHPEHAGDMPPLLADRGGRAFQVFLTDRFSACEIIHRTVVIHAKPDDFITQPSGNSGEKIACGQIEVFGCCCP